MSKPDPETQRQLIKLGLEGLERILRARLEEAAEYRLSPSHCTILGFIRKADDHLYPSWQHFRPDVEKPWEGWAP